MPKNDPWAGFRGVGTTVREGSGRNEAPDRPVEPGGETPEGGRERPRKDDWPRWWFEGGGGVRRTDWRGLTGAGSVVREPEGVTVGARRPRRDD